MTTYYASIVPQNIPECNYDGGDCCSCTCEDTPNQECGQSGGFACIDPQATCVDDDDITVDMLDECVDVSEIGETRRNPLQLLPSNPSSRPDPSYILQWG